MQQEHDCSRQCLKVLCVVCRACGRHHHSDLPVHQHAEEGGTTAVGFPGVQGGYTVLPSSSGPEVVE